MISRDRHARSSRTAPNPRNHLGRLSELDHINQYVMRTIWMVHNHPSGSPEPSRQDIAITKEIASAAAKLGIALHDHIIIGGSDYRSFRAMGLL